MTHAGRARALAVSLAAVPAVALAAAGTPGAAPPATGSAITQFAGFDSIKTASLHYNLNSGDFSFPTHFSATRQGLDISADRATGNSKRKTLHAAGNVVVHQMPTGQPVAGAQGAALSSQPSTLTADKLDVDGVTKIYVATGNMHFSQPGGHEASADKAILDEATHHLHLEGNVVVKDGEQTISASQLDYDTQTGQVDGNGDVTITAPAESPAASLATPRALLHRRGH